MGSCMRLAKSYCTGQEVMICNMTCYIWFERLLCANYDYIRNVVIRSIFIISLEKTSVSQLSRFNNLYNVQDNGVGIFRVFLKSDSPAKCSLELRWEADKLKDLIVSSASSFAYLMLLKQH